MMDDCREVLGALKGRGRALLASNWSISNRFQVGQNPGLFKLLEAGIEGLNSIVELSPHCRGKILVSPLQYSNKAD